MTEELLIIASLALAFGVLLLNYLDGKSSIPFLKLRVLPLLAGTLH